MNRIFRTVKSASNASSLRRVLDTWRSAKVFLNGKCNVIRGATPDADRFKKQAEARKNARQLIREQSKRLERKDRKIEKQAEARKNLRQLRRTQKRNLRRHQQRIQQIKTRLYTLGYTDRALEDLQSLVADDSNPVLQRLAAWELSLWYANPYSEEGARQSLELLPVALQDENDPVQLRRAAIIEAECQEVVGNIEAAKLAISR